MGKKLMAQFISKLTKDFNNTLKLPSGEKANYYAKLFEKTLWFPKLKGTRLTSSESLEKPFAKASGEVFKEAPQAPVKAISEAVKIPDSIPKVAKKVTINPLGGDVPARKLSVEAPFAEFIKQFHSDWKIDSIPGYADYQGEIDIIFFGLDEIEKDELPDFLPLSMIESDQDIMGRMIKAMKITSGRFIRVPFIKESARDFIFSCCAHFKPKILISLGAAATNLCLDTKVRLANVHGEFKSIQIEVDGNTQTIEVMPLFHPKLLEVNESMKKTAWADMQKAIAKLSS